MPAPVPTAAVRRPVQSAGRVAALLACAALAAWAVLADLPLLALLPCAGLGALAGAWHGRRSLARAAARLLLPPPLPERDSADSPGRQLAPLEVAGPAELQPLADSLRALVARQQALFDMQATQLEALRRLAHSDPLTGLANRRHFMAMLDAVLGGGDAAPEAGLLLLRLRDLQGLNQRLGHAAADRALLAVAESLQTYPDRIGRCFAGRLNGADFALLLPVGGMAQETAAALTQAMRLPLAAIDARVRVFAGAVELARPMDATQALAHADAALARAESEGGLPTPAPPAALAPVDSGLPQGEASWQRRISRALLQGRVALGAYPVRTADGRQLHLDCPLRVQLRPDGPMEPAGRWLALAMRSRLCPAVDEKAVALALSAIDADGLARCVNVAAQSVASAEFVAAVARRLAVAALKKFPQFNASLDGEQLVLKSYFHIGFAADTPNGLVVPVIKDADKKGIFQISTEMGELAKKARDGKLGPADMSGGCFSISSLGGIGGRYFTPIINAPEVAIMGVCKSSMEPRWDGQQFAPRLILPLSLSWDHRVIDGAAAARFNVYFASLLADFRRIVL